VAAKIQGILLSFTQFLYKWQKHGINKYFWGQTIVLNPASMQQLPDYRLVVLLFYVGSQAGS